MDNQLISTLKGHLYNLCFERVAGTDGERRARDYIVDVIKSHGFIPEIQPFDINTFKPMKGEIIVGDERFDARPFGGFKSFFADGELQYIEHHSVYENSQDKILMLYYRINPREYIKLTKKKIRGIIVVNRPAREKFSSNIPQKLIEVAEIPILSVSYNTALRLLRYEGKRVRIKGEGRVLESTSANIILRKSTSPAIIVCAHYDTVAYSKGLSDNAGGSAVLLTLLKDFSRRLEFIWFGAEEFGLLGSFNYIKNCNNPDAKLVINVDVTGDDIGTNNVLITGNNVLRKCIRRILKRERLYAKVERDIYSSDSIPFGKLGVPSININRAEGIPSFYIHTEADSATVSGYGLYQTYRIVRSIISNIEREGLPEGMKISRDIEHKIKKYIKDRVDLS